MSGISPSVFLTRDVLEHVIPVALAAVLFAPFVGPADSLNLDLLIVATVLLAYPLSALLQLVCEHRWAAGTMAWLHGLASRRRGPSSENGVADEGDSDGDAACREVGPPAPPDDVPDGDARSILDRLAWQGANWDFDALFNRLDKEEREYFYLTRAYLRLFHGAAFLVLVYALVNLVYWGALTTVGRSVYDAAWPELLALRSPLFRGGAPSLLLAAAGLLLFPGLYGWYLAELHSLFSDWGSYVQTARRLQREEGGLATGIWGRLLPVDQAAGACVELVRDEVLFARAPADDDGWFQLPRTFAPCLGRSCRLRVRLANGRIVERQLVLAEKAIPEVMLDLDRPPAPPPEARPRCGSLLDLLAGALRLLLR